MTLARVTDGAFGLLRAHTRRVAAQVPTAYHHAAHSTAAGLASHANDVLEEAGLGRSFSVWEHQGRLTVGVPEAHPEADDVWAHEFGSPSSAPHASLRRAFWGLRTPAISHFNETFHRGATRGTMWER